MTDDEIISLGTMAAHYLNSDAFLSLTDMWERDCVARMLATPSPELTEREHIYAQLTGFREFQAFLADMVKQARDIQEKYAPKPEDIDDPSVHDIYGAADLMKRID